MSTQHTPGPDGAANDVDIATRCERLFQGGSTRVQVVSVDGLRISSAPSVPVALRAAEANERVFARRKVRGEQRWAWRCVAIAKATWSQS
jgi:hypothetical protein